jgi:hypothetical protein
MVNKRLVAHILMITLVVVAIFASGCSLPGQKKDNASYALDIVLNDPAIKDEITKITDNGVSYSSEAQPADLNVTGYLNYSGNFYLASINTIGRPGEQYNVLVDLNSGREMQVSHRFDVAIYPERILVPGGAAWYHRFPSDAASWAYIEVNMSSMNRSIRPVLVDENNFNRIRRGMPFNSWSLYSLSENATTVNVNVNNDPIATGIDGLKVIPGRITMPGPSVNGIGIKLMFKDPGRRYYYVLINDELADISVESMVIG